ncbi:hypothetical protein PF004_g8701 [Phytophthora fragariae]|uniref:Uncharacterized protein n=1 Tax=Phytophthora fragariae TaxID=53985 RepID=A0A6G0P637_9STRA|nr:hypothetical protein PF004_g8701 [Phytophthora fragariae]
MRTLAWDCTRSGSWVQTVAAACVGYGMVAHGVWGRTDMVSGVGNSGTVSVLVVSSFMCPDGELRNYEYVDFEVNVCVHYGIGTYVK